METKKSVPATTQTDTQQTPRHHKSFEKLKWDAKKKQFFKKTGFSLETTKESSFFCINASHSRPLLALGSGVLCKQPKTNRRLTET